ncbi:MAG: hypothetical protein WBJ81_06475, partial [Rickettsiales bacterium]
NGVKAVEEIEHNIISYNNDSQDSQDLNIEDIKYINTNEQKFYFLGKLISFDESQSLIYSYPLPIVVIGSAGSGRTVLSLGVLSPNPLFFRWLNLNVSAVSAGG